MTAVIVPGCSEPTGTEDGSSAALIIRARIIGPATPKALGAAATTWDSLVAVVSSPSGDTFRSSVALSSAETYITDTIDGIEAGNNLCVELHTVGPEGGVVHVSSSQTVDLAPNAVVSLAFLLSPVSGSIYVALSDVPTSVATVRACFAYADDMLCTEVSRAVRTWLSIDYVPDGASGTLTIVGLGEEGDTVYSSTQVLTFYSDRSQTVEVGFDDGLGGLDLEVTLQLPGVTMVAGSMESEEAIGPENGTLIITEIMYAANGAEYVELHNPGERDTVFDTLYIEKDGTRRCFVDVDVPAGGFYVVGRYDSAWVDTSSRFLDLSSATGNWLVVRGKDEEVFDWVAFDVRSADCQWPTRTSNTSSIVLVSPAFAAADNNYGYNWQPAESPLGASGRLRGTPGRAGA